MICRCTPESISYVNHLTAQYYSRQIKRLRREITGLQMKLNEKNIFIEDKDRQIMCLLIERDELKKLNKKQMDLLRDLQK